VDIEKMFEEQASCILASGGLSVENDLSRRSFREPGGRLSFLSRPMQKNPSIYGGPWPASDFRLIGSENDG
jgi:hypothetical protein